MFPLRMAFNITCGLSIKVLCIFVCFLFLFPCNVLSNRVFEKMYEKIQSNMTCIKKFNGTHEIGCTSKFWGNVGIIHIVENPDNLTWVLENGPHSPYVVALTPELFTLDIIQKASDSKKLSGMLLLGSEKYSRPDFFSPDLTCPNRESSLYRNTSFNDYCERKPWNPRGSSLQFMSWDFPIFLIKEEEDIDEIISCYDKFNKPFEDGKPRDWPLCAIELDSNMHGATSSEVCMRRSEGVGLSLGSSYLCDPLESHNVWVSTKPLNISDPIAEKSVMFMTTSADAASIFDSLSPGANTAISGLVTLLVTVNALFMHKEDFVDSEKTIMFSVLQGEAWDYIGSSRMVYDMEQDKFPHMTIEGQEDQMSNLNLSHIHSIIDLKQVGLLRKKDGSKTLYVHTDPISNKNEDIKSTTDAIVDKLVATSQDFSVKIEKLLTEAPLPPTSLQTFLKKYNISGVVLADHMSEYKNQYYMSIYDDYLNLNYSSLGNETSEEDVLHQDISEVASILATSLYASLTGISKQVEVNASLTNDLLFCFLQNMNCSYFQEISDPELRAWLYPAPAKTFISVKQAMNPLPELVFRLFALFTGQEKVEFNKTNCNANNTQVNSLVYFPFISNGTCMESTVHLSPALSPAFSIKNYDWKSKEYSTWTESVWSTRSARIFLRPAPSEEIGLVISGVFSVILSAIIVYFFSIRANIIFEFEVAPTPC